MSFANKLARHCFAAKDSKTMRRVAPELWPLLRRKLQYLHEAETLDDLLVPAGNRLRQLRGKWSGWHVLIIDNQWQCRFRWRAGEVHEVSLKQRG